MDGEKEILKKEPLAVQRTQETLKRILSPKDKEDLENCKKAIGELVTEVKGLSPNKELAKRAAETGERINRILEDSTKVSTGFDKQLREQFSQLEVYVNTARMGKVRDLHDKKYAIQKQLEKESELEPSKVAGLKPELQSIETQLKAFEQTDEEKKVLDELNRNYQSKAKEALKEMLPFLNKKDRAESDLEKIAHESSNAYDEYFKTKDRGALLEKLESLNKRVDPLRKELEELGKQLEAKAKKVDADLSRISSEIFDKREGMEDYAQMRLPEPRDLAAMKALEMQQQRLEELQEASAQFLKFLLFFIALIAGAFQEEEIQKEKIKGEEEKAKEEILGKDEYGKLINEAQAAGLV